MFELVPGISKFAFIPEFAFIFKVAAPIKIRICEHTHSRLQVFVLSILPLFHCSVCVGGEREAKFA
jgi:hypothetical protein